MVRFDPNYPNPMGDILPIARKLFVGKKLRQNLRRRFSLSDRPELKEPMELSDMVVPVTDVGHLVSDFKIQSESYDISAAAHDGHLVGAGKRRYIHFIRKASTVGSCALQMYDGTNILSLWSSTANAVLNHYPWPGLPMEAGWYLRLTQGNVADTNEDVTILFIEEEVD